jgi:ATP-GRASP peptide maturase of grasp-with-spasm system
MILIVNNEVDFTTDLVCLWLNKTKKKYIRISNIRPLIQIFSDVLTRLEINAIGINSKIDLVNLKSIFYKNSDFSYSINVSTNHAIDTMLTKFIDAEWNIVKEYLKFVINKNTAVIGNIVTNTVNKLIVLNIANQIGIKIPETRIVSTKEGVESFRANKVNIITKPISEVMLSVTEKGKFLNYTRIVDKDEIIPDYICPTLLQEYIEKKYEIRTYFLRNNFWSIAIFSQSQTQTKTDYRNYNYDLSNRSEPFLLPVSLKNKIKQLAKQLQLNSGSVDFIYSTKNEFYFLEINPIGQFSNVSSNGNFNIEKYIAEQL